MAGESWCFQLQTNTLWALVAILPYILHVGKPHCWTISLSIENFLVVQLSSPRTYPSEAIHFDELPCRKICLLNHFFVEQLPCRKKLLQRRISLSKDLDTLIIIEIFALYLFSKNLCIWEPLQRNTVSSESFIFEELIDKELPVSQFSRGTTVFCSSSHRMKFSLGSCHKRQKPQAPTPQAPIRNRQTSKVAIAKVHNRNTNLT